MSKSTNITHEQFKYLFWQARISRHDAQEIFGVNCSTVRRWLNGRQVPKKSVITLLKIMAEGLHHLPGAGAQWEGWKFIDGKLIEANVRESHSTATIRAWHWLAQSLQALRTRENQLIRLIEERDSPNVVALHRDVVMLAHKITEELHDRFSQQEAG